MPNHPSELTPYDLGRGLMRGDRAFHKAGYSAQAAFLAVKKYHALDDKSSKELFAYLVGFADGMNRNEPISQNEPNEYYTGWERGLQEDAFKTLPVEVPGEPTTKGIEIV